MARRDRHPLVRSSPIWGAIGGLVSAAFFQTTGPTYSDGMFVDELQALFDASPILGYVVFVVTGAAIAGAFRAFERWAL